MAIVVNTAELKTKATQLQELNESLKSQIGILDSDEQSLMGMWEGDTKNAFHTAFTNDKTQMENFKAAIDQYVVVLNNIVAKYEKIESDNNQTATTRNY